MSKKNILYSSVAPLIEHLNIPPGPSPTLSPTPTPTRLPDKLEPPPTIQISSSNTKVQINELATIKLDISVPKWMVNYGISFLTLSGNDGSQVTNFNQESPSIWTTTVTNPSTQSVSYTAFASFVNNNSKIEAISNQLTIDYIPDPIIANAIKYCPNTEGSYVSIIFTFGEVASNIITPNLIDSIKQKLVLFGLPATDNGFATHIMLLISQFHDISSSRLCNASITPSLSKFSDDTEFTLNFFITDNINHELNWYENISAKKNSKLKNDYLNHTCIAEWIRYQFNNSTLKSLIDSRNVPNSISKQLISSSCPAQPETFDSQLYEHISAVNKPVPNVAVYNPAGGPPLPSPPLPKDSSPNYILIGLITLVIIILLGLGLYYYNSISKQNPTQNVSLNNEPSGGMFSIGE